MATDYSGQIIGRYHIHSYLGEGGMALVYRATDERLDCTVAVKIINRERISPEVFNHLGARFEREAKAQARLTHPNILKVTDYGQLEDGTPYLVMPLLEGGSLDERLGQPMLYGEAARLLIPVARALKYAHDKGLVHRDVKPSNILLTETGEPVLADFGIAHILTEEKQHLTRIGSVIGTPEYMSPEQCRGKVEPASDQYSLGIVLYEMVTGVKPFNGDSHVDVMIKQATEPPAPPRGILPGLPVEVEGVILRALMKKPEERFESMAAFAGALEGLVMLSRVPAAARPAPAPPPVLSAEDWLQQRADQEAEKKAGENLPDWLLEPAPLPPVLPDVGWLQQLADREPEKKAGENLPEWLRDGTQEPAPTPREVPEWLRAAEAEPEKKAEENVPDWLRQQEDIQAAEDWLQQLADQEPEPEKKAEDDLPEWLRQPEEAEPAPPAAQARDERTLIKPPETPGKPPAALPGLKPEKVFRDFRRKVTGLAFSPDGRFLAVCPDNDALQLLRASDGKVMRTLGGKNDHFSAVAYSPDGYWLGGVCAYQPIRLWAVDDGRLLVKMQGDPADLVGNLAISPDGEFLAAGLRHYALGVWQTGSGRLLRTIKGHTRSVTSLTFTPDSSMLVSGSNDSTIRFWDLFGGDALDQIRGDGFYINHLAFSPDGKMLAVASSRPFVAVWSVAQRRFIHTLPCNTLEVTCVAFSPDGKLLACGSNDRLVRVWRMDSGTLLHVLQGHSEWVKTVAFSPLGGLLASGADDGSVCLWRVEG